MEKGVVFVEVNYRRGPIGFLSVDDLSRYKKAKSSLNNYHFWTTISILMIRSVYPETSGNYGLGDIVTALKWISKNIQVKPKQTVH